MTNAVSLAQQASTGVSPGFRNRIINGAMVIDQRNAGASVTPTDGQYTLDRWQSGLSVSSKYSIQQNAGSVTPPAGFTNYLGITSLSAYSVVSSDIFGIQQRIEAFNTNDLSWGTANAKTVTLSFWVRSSLTGTFGGALRNAAFSRQYTFAYTISAANTWEYKTVTIAGDTSGVWSGTNGIGIGLFFAIATGSNFQNTAGSWGAGSVGLSPTGQTSIVGTNGATFYITGVQLEVGSSATSFEYRPYGTELALCQRYYQRIGGGQYVGIGMGINNGGVNTVACQINYVVAMRASPTFSISGSLIATNRINYDALVTSLGEVRAGLQSAQIQFTHNTAGTNGESEQIAVQGGQTGFINLDSEL